MDPIDEAIIAINSREPGDKLVYQEYADFFEVDRSTLSRRHTGRQTSRNTKKVAQQKLNPQQEEELVLYIEDLTRRGLPPTRDMVRNFASTIAHERVSESWVTRFYHRHDHNLIFKWSTAMDAVRHAADSYHKYDLYFEHIYSKIKEYDIRPENSYNMDEKGFLIGVIGRAKRLFSRRQWEKKEVTAALQDGNREWITVLAAVCGDGTTLPPGLIYASKNSTLQSSWVADIEAGKHDVFVTSTPSGWTNNDTGLAWLEQVFDRCTKRKARRGRAWRLLVLDGHGSHVTDDFINYCLKHCILLVVLPPHSTHTVQPLDVGCFKPLAGAYSKRLSIHTQRSQGLVPIKKGDFFLLFWDAWGEASKKETILSSWAATGVWPMDKERVLKRFRKDDLCEGELVDSSNWRYMERLLRETADRTSNEARTLSQAIHHMAVQSELLKDENKGLRDALRTKKKHNKKANVLDLQQREEYHGGAVIWSPRKFREACARNKVRQDEEEALLIQKAEEKENKRVKKAYEHQAKEKRKVERAAKAEKTRVEKAGKAAERERKKQENDSKRALSTSQTGKRKASAILAPKAKRVRRFGDELSGNRWVEASSAAQTSVSQRGRTTKPRKIFE